MCFVLSLGDGGLLSESSSLSGAGVAARYGRQDEINSYKAMCARLRGR